MSTETTTASGAGAARAPGPGGPGLQEEAMRVINEALATWPGRELSSWNRA